MAVTVQNVVDEILQKNHLRLRFARMSCSRWQGATTRLVQIRNGSFIAPDEVNFILEVADGMIPDQDIDAMFASYNQHEVGSHAHGLPD